MAAYRLTDDIAHWLGIPEIMIVDRNEISRWVDIKCTHSSPLGQAMSEAFLFRVHCSADAKYTIRIRWDTGIEQVMGRIGMSASESTILIHAFMTSDDVLRITKHAEQTVKMLRMHPMLITDIELGIIFIEQAITDTLSKKTTADAVHTNHISDGKSSTAIFLTTMIKKLDPIFAKISAGDDADISGLGLTADDESADEHIPGITQSLNDIAKASIDSNYIYQNWIYAELRYKLRDGMHILYKNQTAQNR
jgi:hypothetical protein